MIAERPVLHDVMVAGGSLVLSWESGNSTSSVQSSTNFTVSIVCYSSDLIEWFYQIVSNGDSVSRKIYQKGIVLALTPDCMEMNLWGKIVFKKSTFSPII